MTNRMPPPLPPRHVSQTVTLARMLDGDRPAHDSVPEDDEPTRPRSIESEVAILASYYKQMAREDRAYLMRLAEGYAARNAKK